MTSFLFMIFSHARTQLVMQQQRQQNLPVPSLIFWFLSGSECQKSIIIFGFHMNQITQKTFGVRWDGGDPRTAQRTAESAEPSCGTRIRTGSGFSIKNLNHIDEISESPNQIWKISTDCGTTGGIPCMRARAQGRAKMSWINTILIKIEIINLNKFKFNLPRP